MGNLVDSAVDSLALGSATLEADLELHVLVLQKQCPPEERSSRMVDNQVLASAGNRLKHLGRAPRGKESQKTEDEGRGNFPQWAVGEYVVDGVHCTEERLVAKEHWAAVEH